VDDAVTQIEQIVSSLETRAAPASELGPQLQRLRA
jgi:hypothetical protein